jgi:hypothetical protein
MRAQDIVAQKRPNETPSGPGSGTAEACEQEIGLTGPQNVTLTFILVDQAGALPSGGGGTTFATAIDLIGPPAPTNVSAGIAEDSLVVKWREPSATDIQGYRLYCDPPRSGSATQPLDGGGAFGGSGGLGTGAFGGTGGATGAGAIGGAGGVFGVGGAGAGGLVGAAGVGGVVGAGGSAGSAGTTSGNAECPSTALVAGQRPDDSYECGSALGNVATEGTASGLTNGVQYAVAVAAVDTVENVGVLSATACGNPEEVDNFFELYRRAGGKGGGGFCAAAAKPAPGAFLLILGALLLRTVRRRRRR